MATEAQQWTPDWAVAPGELLAEALEERQLSQTELARRMDRPLKTVNEIIKGKAALTPATAIQLERTLGISAQLWTNLEANYRQALARQEDLSQLETEAAFLKAFPIRDLIRLGVIPAKSSDPDLMHQLLRFFGVSTANAWRRQWTVLPALRSSDAYASKPEAVAAWVRWGQLQAGRRSVGAYDEDAFILLLQEARRWTRQAPIATVVDKLINRLSAVGVALVLLPELTGTHLNGAAYRTEAGVRVIQLSLRHKRDDQFWFSLFHEAGHVAHSPERLFIDGVADIDSEDMDVDEQVADAFARELLIPTDRLQALLGSPDGLNETAIRSFARDEGIAPGIVVGRLQRDRLVPPNKLNYLKQKLEFA